MSLDVYMYDGEDNGEGRDCVFSMTLSHNANQIAIACGLYTPIWRPEEIEGKKADRLIPFLKKGIETLVERYLLYAGKLVPLAQPEYTSQNYFNLLSFAIKYYSECKEHPDAEVAVMR